MAVTQLFCNMVLGLLVFQLEKTDLMHKDRYGLVLITELKISKETPLQSNSSVEVVKKCSLPCGRSL